MGQKAETVFRKKVRKDLEKLPLTTIFTIQQRTLCGDPDFILCVRGEFVALELKKSAQDKPRKLQLYRAHLIEQSLGKAFTVHPENWKQVLSILTLITKGEWV